MPELAEVLRRFGPAYRAQYGPRLLPSHRAAMRAIEECRTPALGGHLWRCDNEHCKAERYVYHSCRNRSCPKCHGEQTARWLATHRARLPACSYFLLTATLPCELRSLTRSHQRVMLAALARSTASSLLKLCRDPTFLGATPCILVVLHTWTQDLRYHPHVHLLVSAGGLDSKDRWITPRHDDYLVPQAAVAKLLRGKMKAALRRGRLLSHVPPSVWSKPWVVHCQHAGSGERVLSYLARYVFRVAITNARIEAINDDAITFRVRDRKTGKTKHRTLPPLTFLARFLQHVLPRGFHKVRSYGLLAPRNHSRLNNALAQLAPPTPPATALTESSLPGVPTLPNASLCPVCRTGTLRAIHRLPPCRGPP